MTYTNTKKMNANIMKLTFHNILRNLFFAVPVIVIFWGDNGLSLTEIMILQSIASLTMVVLEVPTGYIADIFGRKQSLLLSTFCLTIAIILLSLGHNFIEFLVAEIFFALSMALSSGADSAFMYDTLKDLGKEKQYKKVWGNYMMYGMIALGASNILGGIIGKYDLRWTLYASIPFFFLSMLTTLTLKEPQRHKRIFKQGYLWELFKIMKEALWENVKLRWLILFAGIAFAMNQSGLWLYQPYFEISGLDIAYFGVAFSLFHIIAGLASKFSHIIEDKLKLQLSLALIIICTALGYFLMSYIVFWWSFVFIFLFQFVRGFSQPVIADAIHKVTDSSIRATVLSVQSLMGRLFYAILLPFIGWAADVYTITQALFLLGILTVGLGIVFGIMLWKNKSVET